MHIELYLPQPLYSNSKSFIITRQNIFCLESDSNALKFFDLWATQKTTKILFHLNIAPKIFWYSIHPKIFHYQNIGKIFHKVSSCKYFSWLLDAKGSRVGSTENSRHQSCLECINLCFVQEIVISGSPGWGLHVCSQNWRSPLLWFDGLFFKAKRPHELFENLL